MKKGIDISLWDPPLDWSKYDWDFAFIKVSEGIVIDPRFDIHWAPAKGHTQRGGYHMFRAFVDPIVAAARFVEYLDGDVGELPPVLDLEYADNVDARTIVSRALTWLIEVEKRINVTPIVYSRTTFLRDTLKIFNYPDFEKYPLWEAVYNFDNLSDAPRAAILHSILTGEKELFIPPIPKPFKKRPYIQWTAKGSPFDVPGYYTGTGHKKAVDFNFQLEEEPTDPDDGAGEPMPETIKEGTVSRTKLGTATTLQIRSGAGLSFADIGDLHAGDRVYGRIVSAVWLEFNKIIRANDTVEFMHGFASTQYMEDLRDVPVEPPTEPSPESLPAYFTAHDAAGNELGRYNKQ